MSGWRKRQVTDMARESWLDVYGLGHDRQSFVKALEAFAELVRKDEREMLAQPAPYMAVSTDRMSVDPHTGNVSIGTVAQPAPVQEPVFCEYCGGNDDADFGLPTDHCTDCTRPQRTWVGLTDEQIEGIAHDCGNDNNPWCDKAFARAIEAAHDIKENT